MKNQKTIIIAPTPRCGTDLFFEAYTKGNAPLFDLDLRKQMDIEDIIKGEKIDDKK